VNLSPGYQHSFKPSLKTLMNIKEALNKSDKAKAVLEIIICLNTINLFEEFLVKTSNRRMKIYFRLTLK
jgi:hypothetical protein